MQALSLVQLVQLIAAHKFKYRLIISSGLMLTFTAYTVYTMVLNCEFGTEWAQKILRSLGKYGEKNWEKN